MEIVNPRTGIKMNVNIDGEGEPAVIFIHGWTANHMRWARVKKIVANEYRCIDFDLRGHGHSQKTHDLEYNFELFVEDLAGLMDELKIEKAVLIGHSMGGMIAQHFTLKYPERVIKLVLVATSSRVADSDKERKKLRLFSWLFRHMFPVMISIKDAKKKKQPDKFPDLQDNTLRSSPKAAADCIIAISQLDIVEKVKTIKAPTLIFAAEDDETVPIRFTREMAEAIPGAKLVLYDGPCGHHVNIEKHQEAAGEILSFIK